MRKTTKICVKTLLGALLLTLAIKVFFNTLVHADEIQLLSVEQARLFKAQEPRTIYVDVRDGAKFEKSHIPTAINIPLHFIKTKAYLKDMTVILVGNGYDPEKLVSEQKRLSEKGFNAHIIAGGVAAWQQQGFPLTGHPNPGDLHMVPAQNFLPGLSPVLFKLFIDSSKEPSAPLTDTSISVPATTLEGIPQLLEIVKQSGLSEQDAVLIYNQDGDYTHLQKFPKNCRPTIFFLAGGINSFNTASEQAQAMLKSKESRIKKIGGCPTCPPQEKQTE